MSKKNSRAAKIVRRELRAIKKEKVPPVDSVRVWGLTSDKRGNPKYLNMRIPNPKKRKLGKINL